MKIQNRLLAAFSLYLLFLMSVGLAGTIYSINSNRNLNDLSGKIFSSQRHINTIRLEINLIYSEILTDLLNRSDRIDESAIDGHALVFYDELESLSRLHSESPEDSQNLRNRFQEFLLHAKWVAQIGGNRNLADHPDALNTFLERKNRLFDLFDSIAAHYQKGFITSFEEINRHTMEFLLFALVLVLTGFFVAFAVAYILSRSIARPINILTENLSLVEKGIFQVHSDIEGDDEIGRMAKAVNSMSSELDTRFRKMNYLQSLLQSILDSVSSMVIAVDENRLVTHWNRSTAQFTDVTADKATGAAFSDVFPPEILSSDMVIPVLEEKKTLQIEKRSVLYDGRERYYNYSIYPQRHMHLKGAVILIRDITDEVMMHDVMIQSEKMLSVGGLAAGMAHEINNPLAGIIQTISVLKKRLMGGTSVAANATKAEEAGIDLEKMSNYMKLRDIPRMFESIAASGRQITEIVDNMLSFSRKGNDRASSQDMEELIDKTIKLAVTDYDLKKDYDFRQIEIQRDYCGNLPPLVCESSKIQQVILNLLRNGAQAMQGEPEKTHRFIIRTALLKDRNMISIEIEDNGPGMSEEIRKKVFEPFFTTKAEGLGTGLGLSVSYFIVTETHNGELFVKSRLGEGTVFTINLPIQR
ncbi:ATP-binding protein [Spirochaeta isovalerica]|uniref:histidine kinase n=1 Tax=Spirochaeta isovalerica TaxID=150 RepID=A0A841RCI1_9SPIO|nr:ATP-binding protein [Spirochaeta isovalerica]MBB6480579.1 PAS domain S-box-containing protein [Spirochaeta isovalerica]